jgi:epoxyqueuosine reductase
MALPDYRSILTHLATDQGFSAVRFADGGPFGMPENSIMIAAFPCTTEDEVSAPASSGNTSAEESLNGEGACVAAIAPFARRNYYREAVGRLKSVAKTALTGFSSGDFRIFSNSTLSEKSIASSAGLGFIGKNGLLTTIECGSLCILAGIVLPFPVTNDAPVAGGCGSCRSCVEACPTGALGDPAAKRGEGERIFIRERCIQYWASRFEVLPEAVASRWGNRLYGCTACQDACPFNREKAEFPRRARGPVTGKLDKALPVSFLLGKTAEELGAFFRGTALGMKWIEKTALQRNAILAAASRTLVDRGAGAEWRDAENLAALVAVFRDTGLAPFVQAAEIALSGR